MLLEQIADLQGIFERAETAVNTDHATENHGVPGSSPVPATFKLPAK
jgi:hypothetical protein